MHRTHKCILSAVSKTEKKSPVVNQYLLFRSFLPFPTIRCSRQYCFDCLSQHRTSIAREFDQLQNNHDQIRERINELKSDPTKHSLSEQIDQWESDAIYKIQQMATKYKTQWIDYSKSLLVQIEKKLNHLAEQIKDIHRENAFNEFDLNQFRQRLKILYEELNRPFNVSIQQQSTSFINKISLLLPSGKSQLKVLFL